jgi:hypothetical protein
MVRCGAGGRRERDGLDGDEIARVSAELELTVLQLPLEGLHTT